MQRHFQPHSVADSNTSLDACCTDGTGPIPTFTMSAPLMISSCVISAVTTLPAMMVRFWKAGSNFLDKLDEELRVSVGDIDADPRQIVLGIFLTSFSVT